MADPSDQPSNRTKRGPLLILVLAAVLVAGLWYWHTRTDTQDPPEAPDTSAAPSGTLPEAGGSRTADTGTAPTTDSGIASATGDLQSTDTGTADPADTAQTADSGTTRQMAGMGTANTGAATGGQVSETAIPGEAVAPGAAQATDSEPGVQVEELDTARSDTGDPAEELDSARSDTGDPAEELDSARSDTGDRTEALDTARSDAGDRVKEPDTGRSGAPAPTGIALAAGSDVRTGEGEPGTATAGSVTADRTTAVRPTEPDPAARANVSGATGPGAAGAPGADETDSRAATSAGQSAGAGTVEGELQIVAAEPGTAGADEELLLAVVPEDTVERVPIDAPPGTDGIAAPGVLDAVEGAVEQAIEQIETVIEETLDAVSDLETKLRVQVTYDDTLEETEQAAAEPDESALADDPGAGQLAAPEPTADPGAGQLATPEPTTDPGADQLAAPDPTTDPGADQLAAPDPTTDSGAGQLAAADPATDPDAERLAAAGPTTGSVVTPPAGDAQGADSELPSTAHAADSARAEGAVPSDDTRTASADTTDAEADEYVENLTETAPAIIPVDKADHFVTQDHVISMVPEDTIESVTVEELTRDESLDADSPITIVREVEQLEPAVPEQLIAESGGDLDTKLHVLVKYDDTVVAPEEEEPEPQVAEQEATEQQITEQKVTEQKAEEQKAEEQKVTEKKVAEKKVAEPTVAEPEDAESRDTVQTVAALEPTGPAEPESAGETTAGQDIVEQMTVREILERMQAEPERPISLIKKVRFFEVVTLRELLDAGVDTETFLNVVRRPYRLEVATLADLLQRKKEENPDTIFYLHTVQDTDIQGIWGIVHFGLIDNFARGVAIRRGEDIETYRVKIPRDADERLEDQSSSFLGRLIDRKTKDSYVYNYRDNRMGRNPDRIFPGQEIVIINFEPDDLKSIYKHFARG